MDKAGTLTPLMSDVKWRKLFVAMARGSHRPLVFRVEITSNGEYTSALLVA